MRWLHCSRKEASVQEFFANYKSNILRFYMYIYIYVYISFFMYIYVVCLSKVDFIHMYVHICLCTTEYNCICFFCKDMMVQVNSDLLFSLSFFASFSHTRLDLTHTLFLSSSRTRSLSLSLSLSFSLFFPCLCAPIYICATHTPSPLLFVGLYACEHVGSNLSPT